MSLRLLVAFVVALVGAQEIATRKPGSDVPPFELQTLDGKKVTSAELLGDAKERNLLVVVFGAVHCVDTGRVNDACLPDAGAASTTKPAIPPPPVNPLLKKAILAAIDGNTPELTTDVPTGCRIKRQ